MRKRELVREEVQDQVESRLTLLLLQQTDVVGLNDDSLGGIQERFTQVDTNQLLRAVCFMTTTTASEGVTWFPGLSPVIPVGVPKLPEASVIAWRMSTS
jgi:hypothetical protein